MKKIAILLIFVLFNIKEAGALNIFACEPEWASLADEIGGEKIKTFSATTAFQDAHYVQARPSLISNMRKADLVICSGADLEAGWLPILIQKAGKKETILASEYVETLDKPQKVDRSEGDVHPDGNPHIHLDPYNILKIAKIIAEKLSEMDSTNEKYYEKNYNEFKNRWENEISKWEQISHKLEGINVITRHKNFSYLFAWLKINNVETLEPKPGVPPTSKHLSKLVETAKEKGVKFIIYAPFDDAKSAEWLADKTKIPSIKMPYTVGGKNSKNLFELYNETLGLMLDKQEK